jgi:hypothetical protein
MMIDDDHEKFSLVHALMAVLFSLSFSHIESLCFAPLIHRLAYCSKDRIPHVISFPRLTVAIPSRQKENRI